MPRHPSTAFFHYDPMFVERGEWEDDAEYPDAPLPAHERVWRHPSEQGSSVWIQSEPPLVVGRGLSVATGTVGAVLAVGLLWLMIPHNNRGGGGGVAEVSSTVRSIGAEEFSIRQTSTSLHSFVTIGSGLASNDGTSSEGASAEGQPSTAAPATTPRTLVATPATGNSPTTFLSTVSIPGTDPASNPPLDPSRTTTAALVSAPVASSTSSAPVQANPSRDQAAVGVALAPGPFVVVTALAVGGRSMVMVQLSTGTTVVGTVVSNDAASGIAVLLIPNDVQTSPIQPSEVALPTDGAKVLSPDATPVSVWRDGTGTQISYDPKVHLIEGALVLDPDDNLIGMCTMTDHGPRLLNVHAMLDAVQAAISYAAQPWLGATVKPDDTGNLAVKEINVEGAAAAAGVQIGDIVRTIDGLPFATSDGVRAYIRSHHIGDTVTLSVVHPGVTDPVDIPVTLTGNPGSL